MENRRETEREKERGREREGEGAREREREKGGKYPSPSVLTPPFSLTWITAVP